jgi:4-methyl-5(b-hydroxyethyl)-thiazole monophosphate biosynthesis
MDKCVLIVLGEGFEETEAVLPADILRRTGARVLFAAAVAGQRLVAGGCIRIETDGDLVALSKEPFDVLLLPGGSAVTNLRSNGDVLEVVRRTHRSGKIIAAICAAPLILKDAEILEGKKYTAYPSVLDELPDAEKSSHVVVDGTLITANGPGSAAEFGFAIAQNLVGNVAASRIAATMGFI